MHFYASKFKCPLTIILLSINVHKWRSLLQLIFTQQCELNKKQNELGKST